MNYIDHREKIYEIAQRFVRVGQEKHNSSGWENAMHSLFIQLLDACKEANLDRDSAPTSLPHTLSSPSP